MSVGTDFIFLIISDSIWYIVEDFSPCKNNKSWSWKYFLWNGHRHLFLLMTGRIHSPPPPPAAFSTLFNQNSGMCWVFCVYLYFHSNVCGYLECIRLQIILQRSPAWVLLSPRKEGLVSKIFSQSVTASGLSTMLRLFLSRNFKWFVATLDYHLFTTESTSKYGFQKNLL